MITSPQIAEAEVGEEEADEEVKGNAEHDSSQKLKESEGGTRKDNELVVEASVDEAQAAASTSLANPAAQ